MRKLRIMLDILTDRVWELCCLKNLYKNNNLQKCNIYVSEEDEGEFCLKPWNASDAFYFQMV